MTLSFQKIRIYSIWFLGIQCICLALVSLYKYFTEYGLNKIPPLGVDFISFYAASHLIQLGNAVSVYSRAIHETAQYELFSGQMEYYAFFYPPFFMLVCSALSSLSYNWALIVWLTITGGLCLAALRKLAPPQWGLAPILAFPGVLMTVGHGQSSFLVTALMGGAILALDRRPIVAGVLFGALALKPQFAVLVPVFLIAAGLWRTALSAAATVVTLTAVTTAIYGPAIWPAFVSASELGRLAMENNEIGFHRFQSVFAMARLVGASIPTAYLLQTLTGLAAAVTLVIACRRARGQGVAALMVAGIFLTSPFALVYDLMLLAIPLIWLCGEGFKSGFRRGEAPVALAAYMLPTMAVPFAQLTSIVIAPFVIAALFAVIARRVLSQSDARNSPENADPRPCAVQPLATPSPT